MTDGGSFEDELEQHGEQLHCPVEGCDWWVPNGMGYCYADHREYHKELRHAYIRGYVDSASEMTVERIRVLAEEQYEYEP